jgi:hypothetical protein
MDIPPTLWEVAKVHLHFAPRESRNHTNCLSYAVTNQVLGPSPRVAVWVVGLGVPARSGKHHARRGNRSREWDATRAR